MKTPQEIAAEIWRSYHSGDTIPMPGWLRDGISAAIQAERDRADATIKRLRKILAALVDAIVDNPDKMSGVLVTQAEKFLRDTDPEAQL